tara:strand:+ start:412 stop:900 length:489 start_codon:yes stop_codon:yes gene_type:complete
MSDLKSFIKREVQKVILLEKKKGDGPVKKGKLGRGGIKAKIKEAGALASEKPQELMKKLGISGAASGASDYDMVVNLIRSAIFGNETMGAAYGGAKINTVSIGGDKQKVVIVTTRKISPRDGALYMLHTLTGAHNAGYLSALKSELEVSVENGEITVIFHSS